MPWAGRDTDPRQNPDGGMGMNMKIKGDAICGKVEARAFGAYPESLLNAAGAAGLELWNVKSIDDNTLSFELYESNLKELERLCDKCFMELEYKCRSSVRNG